ncbi:MAG: hypothetical protein A3205_05720 [Methanomassiliicoccales archaeon Mx-03]|nr:MAG: hypothetical protein A3205_05720 [Methanomassiliicoccales archaeon Mx-03]
MTDAFDVLMLFAVATVPLIAYCIGKRMRARSHSVIPFKDPVSLILMVLSFVPLILDLSGYAVVDPFDPWLLAGLFGFWAGYCVGYCSESVDLIYVAVHQIADRTQDVDYVVRYWNREGQMCWQPQSFRAICKTMILGIHNPLYLVPVQRTRRVTVHQFMRPKVTVDAIDLAGIESNEYTIKRGPKGRINWTVEALRYTPSPHCTDAPYDWIANALGYEELFQNYASLQIEHLETNAKLRVGTMKSSGELLSAMGAKAPSPVVMEQLGLDLERLFGSRLRKMRQDAEKETRRVMEDGDE